MRVLNDSPGDCQTPSVPEPQRDRWRDTRRMRWGEVNIFYKVLVRYRFTSSVICDDSFPRGGANDLIRFTTFSTCLASALTLLKSFTPETPLRYPKGEGK